MAVSMMHGTCILQVIIILCVVLGSLITVLQNMWFSPQE